MWKWTFRTILIAVALAWTAVAVRAEDADRAAQPALQTYLSANGMLHRGLYELAAAEYRKFLNDNPKHEKAAVARYGLGICLFRMEKFDDAAVELSRLAESERFEFAAEVSTMLGQCRLAEKQYDKAADSFETVVGSHADHSLGDDAAAGLVEALHLAGKHEAAVAKAKYFASRWPDNPLRERVEYFAGLSEVARKEYARAASHFEVLAERFPDGPFAEQSALLLAQCYQQQGDALEKSVKQYRATVKKAGDDADPEALLGLATVLRQNGDVKEAAKVLDGLLENHPKCPQAASARLLRGRIHFENEQFGKALPLFDQVADDGGELAEHGAYWAAKCALRSSEFADAAKRLARAIERHPQSTLAPEMHYDRAVALIRDGKLADAVAALREFLARFADHGLAADALHLCAATEHQQAHYRESNSLCADFLTRFPSHQQAPTIAFLAAENEFLDNRLDEAARKYEAFLDRHADDAQAAKARFRLGTALYRLNRFDEARRHLSGVAKFAANDAAFRPALMALGDIAFQGGEWKPAEQYFSTYLETDQKAPSADEALLKLGLARQRQERHADAVATYDELLERFDDSPHRLQAVFERGQALVTLQKFDEAAAAFEVVVREGKDSPFAPYALNHLAALAARRNDFAKAAELLEKTASNDQAGGLAADAAFQKAQVLMADRRFAAAETAFAEFIKRFPQDPRTVPARANRAIALSRQDKHEDAVEVINDLNSGELEKLDERTRTNLAYENAWSLRKLGRTADAAKAYRRLIDSGQGEDLQHHAVLELAGIETADNRFSEAAEILRPLLEKLDANPSASEAALREQTVYRLASCEFELSRFKEAAELFDRFLEDFPKSPHVHAAAYQSGEAWFQLGRFENAAKSFTRVVEGAENNDFVAPAILRLGESYTSLQRWPAAERAFTDYLTRFKDSSVWFQAQFGIGWARENQKRYAEAVSAYQDVVNRHRGATAARAQFQIGECLFAQERFEDAARELLKVDILFAYPEWSAAALFEAGRCFEKLGKTAEARTQFSHVTEKHKDTRWASMAAQRLVELSSALSPPGHGR